MKIKRRSTSPLRKRARRPFRGYPIGTVAFYGPDDSRASKVAAGVILREGEDPAELKKWFLESGDIRRDAVTGDEITAFFQQHGVRSVVVSDRIIGCPHEEGIDYPEGAVCPECPFWAIRDRWTGEIVQ